jgi:hypothetical protein
VLYNADHGLGYLREGHDLLGRSALDGFLRHVSWGS